MKIENKRCCKNCVHCEHTESNDMYLCKLRGKFFDNEKSLHYFCANFELQRNENMDEEMTPANFLWLIVFILVFLCALFAILEYSGIINYLS